VGVHSIARQLGLKSHIVLDPLNNSAKNLLEMVKREAEYKDVFLSPAEAQKQADPNTLLCVVDTSRPEQLDDPELLKLCGRVVVIDHHRVGNTFISEPALDFIEPYASSACELVTEILQELMDTQPLRCEAEALLSGIVLDTKSFTLRTGERTFDAAAYLRRCGADTSAVKKLLQSDMEHTVARYKILQSAELYKGIAIAVPDETQDRVVAAQAADELLNISGVDASIVIATGSNGQCFASARSIGDVNSQLIMEKLGGGGNAGAAAVQFIGVTLPEAVQKVYAAIDDYLS
jgi:c-di-AMP phosphodiesterase-like protein